MPSLRWTRVSGRQAEDAGFPPLVAIHGFATTVTQCWLSTGWLKRLDSRRDLILLHLPWHTDESAATSIRRLAPDRVVREGSIALSDSSAHPLGIPDVLDAAADAVRQAPVDPSRAGIVTPSPRTVDLLGYSLGARLAWDLAVEEPVLVRRLVLGGLPAHDELAEVARFLRSGPQRRVEEAPESVAEIETFVQDSPLPADDLAVCADRLSTPPFLPAEEHSPTQPTLLAVGGKDRVAWDSSELLAFLRPDARYLALPRRTHANALTSGAFTRAVQSFLEED